MLDLREAGETMGRLYVVKPTEVHGFAEQGKRERATPGSRMCRSDGTARTDHRRPLGSHSGTARVFVQRPGTCLTRYSDFFSSALTPPAFPLFASSFPLAFDDSCAFSF